MNRFTVLVYFSGAFTVWSGRIDEREIIAQYELPWLWLARFMARGALGNQGRCGYAILRDGEKVEEHAAEVTAVSAV